VRWQAWERNKAPSVRAQEEREQEQEEERRGGGGGGGGYTRPVEEVETELASALEVASKWGPSNSK
jgi:hypothetical protein